jgi:hypothetical protein
MNGRICVNAMAHFSRSPYHFYSFYCNPDTRNSDNGTSFNYFLYSMNDLDMEKKHDYVQWVFPNPEPSKAQDEIAQYECKPEEYALLMGNPVVMRRIEDAISKMLMFWGISYNRVSNVIGVLPADRNRFIKKLVKADHNQLRFTRMLIFLRHIHRDDLAHMLFGLFRAMWLEMDVNNYTWNFWCEALGLHDQKRVPHIGR